MKNLAMLVLRDSIALLGQCPLNPGFSNHIYFFNSHSIVLIYCVLQLTRESDR